MVLSPPRPGQGRPYVPGKPAWRVLAADWSNGASATGVAHAGDDQRTLVLKSEIDHAGA